MKTLLVDDINFVNHRERKHPYMYWLHHLFRLVQDIHSPVIPCHEVNGFAITSFDLHEAGQNKSEEVAQKTKNELNEK